VLQHQYVEAARESRSGYEILIKQPSAPEKWLQTARTDLTQAYEALHQPDEAKRFRTELSAKGEKQIAIASEKH
jgi:hypothetical protein